MKTKNFVLFILLSFILLCIGCGRCDTETIDEQLPVTENVPLVSHDSVLGTKTVYASEFPKPTATAYGLTSEQAHIYNAAVSHYNNDTAKAWLPEQSTDLILLRLTQYGNYQDIDGSITYIIGMNAVCYWNLGKSFTEDCNFHVGGMGYPIAITLDEYGNCIGYRRYSIETNSQDIYEILCGPRRDIANALAGLSDYPSDPIIFPALNNTDLLLQYLRYNFSEVDSWIKSKPNSFIDAMERA